MSYILATRSPRVSRRISGLNGFLRAVATPTSSLPNTADDLDMGPAIVSYPNVVNGKRGRTRGRGYVLPVTDYALPPGYVEPFYGEEAQQQPNYPMSLGARGYIADHSDEEYGWNEDGGGLGALPTIESMTTDTSASDAALLSSGASSGDSFASVLKAVVPAVVQGGASVFSAYTAGRAMVQSARLSMAGEGPVPAPMPAYVPQNKQGSGIPSWLLPAGLAVAGILLVTKLL